MVEIRRLLYLGVPPPVDHVTHNRPFDSHCIEKSSQHKFKTSIFHEASHRVHDTTHISTYTVYPI